MKINRGVRQFVSNSSVSVRTLVVSVRGVSQFVSNSCISLRALVVSVRALVQETKALTDDSIALLIKQRSAKVTFTCHKNKLHKTFYLDGFTLYGLIIDLKLKSNSNI